MGGGSPDSTQDLAQMEPVEKHNLFGHTADELSDLLVQEGQPAFRGRQLARWIYHQRTTDFAEMTNFSSPLRDRLAAKYVVTRPSPTQILRSSDGTKKMSFALDGGIIESVLMFDADRRTLCVSSQIGCALGCTFCATGTMGYTRNLTAGEMMGQVLAANDILGPKTEVTNLVFMGMGEPLLNYENLVTVIRMLCSELGPSISQRKMTVSTVGLPKYINNLAQSGLKVGLAVSLFCAEESTRRKFMPTAAKYPLAEIKKAALAYTQKTGRRVTFEITLIADVNDSIEHAQKLVTFIHGIPCKINLIRFHPHQGTPLRKPAEERVLAFRDYLYPRAPAVTIRKSFGEDIAAACGQLAAFTSS